MAVSKARRATEPRDSGRKRNADYGPQGRPQPGWTFQRARRQRTENQPVWRKGSAAVCGPPDESCCITITL